MVPLLVIYLISVKSSIDYSFIKERNIYCAFTFCSKGVMNCITSQLIKCFLSFFKKKKFKFVSLGLQIKKATLEQRKGEHNLVLLVEKHKVCFKLFRFNVILRRIVNGTFYCWCLKMHIDYLSWQKENENFHCILWLFCELSSFSFYLMCVYSLFILLVID